MNDSTKLEISAARTDIDGRIAQGWGGLSPNGVHLNVLAARRGSVTAAAIATAFTSPSDGYTPVLACVGPDQPSYVTVNPPTVILSKTRAQSGVHENVIFGAAPVGISQGVLDAVANGLVKADQDTLLLVSLWIDTAANDETAVKDSARAATNAALGEIFADGHAASRSGLVSQRESLRHPFYGGE